MAIVSYNSNAIIPAPFVHIEKTYQRAGDGTIIGSLFNITLQGFLISYKGSPQSSGTFWTTSGYPPDENIADASSLESLLKKQQALRQLFSVDGQQLVIQSTDGSAPLKCNPRILGPIDFPAGNWYNRHEYTIALQADAMYINGSPLGEDNFTSHISEATETWSLETDESQPENELLPRTYRLAHAISAQGKRFFDDTGTLTMPAWQQAQAFVLSKLGIDTTAIMSSGVNNLPSYYGGWNYLRNEQKDILGGRYEVTENWIIASGNTLENYSVESSVNNLDGYNTATVNGTITGLAVYNSDLQLLISKYTAASGRYATVNNGLAFTRALTYSGLTLNPIPTQTTETQNVNTGNITYSYTYNNRPSNYVTGTKSEVIAISRTFGIDVFGEVPVLGRLAGPVLQPINTKQAATVGLNIELVFGPAFAGIGNLYPGVLTSANPGLNDPQKSQIQTIVNAANPRLNGLLNNVGIAGTTAYVKNQSENWSPREGRYSLQVEWVFE